MKLAIIALVVSLFSPWAEAQRPPHPKLAEIQQAMKRVAFLVGEWEGEATMRMMGEEHEIRGTESVESRVDGLALIIEGRHWQAGGSPEHLQHHALAVLTYDPEAGHYRFRTQLAQGGQSDATGQMTGDAFRWSMKNPQGEIRFTIRLNEKGDWVELGEMSRDGEEWVSFFEMTMRRRPN